jgi:hypothetical protein
MSWNKKRILLAVCIWLAGVSAACGAVTADPTAAVGLPPATASGPTGTRTLPATATVSPTPSEIPTVEPVLTATAGPAPAVELLNVAFPPNEHGNTLIAEMRNNTGRAMVFPGPEKALRLEVEHWWENYYYYHSQEEVYVNPGHDEKKMNCILYPGETGIIAFDISNLCASDSKNCLGPWGKLESPPAQLGYRLNGYEAYYRTWDEVYKRYPHNYDPEIFAQYHPEHDNLTYEIRGANIVINYDMNLVVRTTADLYQQESWIILYDTGGRIINVLYTDLDFKKTPYKYFQTGRYHIYGIGGSEMPKEWETPGIDNQWWQPQAILTAEDLSRVARIRVFDEISDGRICSYSLEGPV